MATVGDINPQTGQRYSPQEIQRINSGLDPFTGLAGTAATPVTGAPTPKGSGVKDVSGLQASLEGGWTTSDPYSSDIQIQMLNEGTFPSAGILYGQAGAPTIEQLLAGNFPQVGDPTAIPTVEMPTFEPGAISPPTLTPAPPYEISPEQQELMDTLGTQLTDWVTSGGYGIPEETQAQMIQQQTDTLKAREQESIRVMNNNMERRGITNSGFVYANEQAIRSNTSVAIAGVIADVQIKSALMKMASFEKAMGAAAQFLGYLSEQSQLQYAPQFATWQAEQLATMQAWQADFDKYKIELNYAYQTQNTLLQSQLLSEQAEIQHGWDIELAEMEIEMNQNIAQAQGAGQLIGSASGLVGSFIAGS